MPTATFTAGDQPVATAAPLPYRDDLEQPAADEAETFDKILAAFRGISRTTEARYGRSVRPSHAKSHGVVRAELEVLADLPPELAQGLFAAPRTYPAVVRLASTPGELLDDSRVQTPNGMAVKVIGVDGPRLADDDGDVTQDFVFANGRSFTAPTPKAFLANFRLIAASTAAPEGFKAAVSSASLAGTKVFKAVGVESQNLDFFGHPSLHPLTETYYSQIPFRYGDYVAKFCIRPAGKLGQRADTPLDRGHDPDALRTATKGWLDYNPAEYELAVQLRTDAETMPIEDGHAVWPEDASPYRTVARLRVAVQDAYEKDAVTSVDECLSFSPGHTLAAHRPLGGLGRARLFTYRQVAAARRAHNGAPQREPCSLDDAVATGFVPRTPTPRPSATARLATHLDAGGLLFKGAARGATDPDRLARGLGWFSIGLGLAELLAPRAVGRASGLSGHETLLRGYGLREFAAGVGLLLAAKKAPWVWARVAGDALDAATLLYAMRPGNPGRARAAAALAAVSPVVMADLLCAWELQTGKRPF